MIPVLKTAKRSIGDFVRRDVEPRFQSVRRLSFNTITSEIIWTIDGLDIDGGVRDMILHYYHSDRFV